MMFITVFLFITTLTAKQQNIIPFTVVNDSTIIWKKGSLVTLMTTRIWKDSDHQKHIEATYRYYEYFFEEHPSVDSVGKKMKTTAIDSITYYGVRNNTLTIVKRVPFKTDPIFIEIYGLDKTTRVKDFNLQKFLKEGGDKKMINVVKRLTKKDIH